VRSVADHCNELLLMADLQAQRMGLQISLLVPAALHYPFLRLRCRFIERIVLSGAVSAVSDR
jgi:hypothetical protein